MKDEFSILIDSHAVNMSSSDDRWRLPDNLKCSFNIVFQDHVDNVVPLCFTLICGCIKLYIYMCMCIYIYHANILEIVWITLIITTAATTTPTPTVIITTITKTHNTTKSFRKTNGITWATLATAFAYVSCQTHILMLWRNSNVIWLSIGWPVAMWFLPFQDTPFDWYPLVAMYVHPATISISASRDVFCNSPFRSFLALLNM